MMPQAEQFPFLARGPFQGPSSLFPILPFVLAFRGQSLPLQGVLDTAASVNVLPFDVGLQLGASWAEQGTELKLAGNLAHDPARALVLRTQVSTFPPVDLAFAWTKNNSVPVLLGQINFFLDFDVCLFRTREIFEVRPRAKKRGPPK